MDSQSGVQSLDRAFGLLETLSLQPDGMQLTELTQVTGLHKSTIHRLLASLIKLGYVKKAEDSGRYRLSLKLVELSGRIVDSMDVLRVSGKFLDRLRDQVQETVHLVVREGVDILYTYKAESLSSSYRMASRVGMRRALYCTAAGKSILATMPDAEVAAIWAKSDIQAITPHTIVNLECLMEELAQVRRLGYALDNEENALGVRCIGAAISDYTGIGSAAFSVSAPVVRMSDQRVAALAAEVLAIRKQISGELGYRGK